MCQMKTILPEFIYVCFYSCKHTMTSLCDRAIRTSSWTSISDWIIWIIIVSNWQFASRFITDQWLCRYTNNLNLCHTKNTGKPWKYVIRIPHFYVIYKIWAAGLYEKSSDFAKTYRKNCSFSSFATRVTADFAQGGRGSWKLGQSALKT